LLDEQNTIGLKLVTMHLNMTWKSTQKYLSTLTFTFHTNMHIFLTKKQFCIEIQ